MFEFFFGPQGQGLNADLAACWAGPQESGGILGFTGTAKQSRRMGERVIQMPSFIASKRALQIIMFPRCADLAVASGQSLAV